MAEPSDIPDDLSPRERARLRRREKKRVTAMVVDNAAVKRTALALANRRRGQAPPPERP